MLKLSTTQAMTSSPLLGLLVHSECSRGHCKERGLLGSLTGRQGLGVKTISMHALVSCAQAMLKLSLLS